MMLPTTPKRVFLAVGNTDMRKSINGLSVLVERAMDMDPFDGDLFVFCNQRRNMIKILYWNKRGEAMEQLFENLNSIYNKRNLIGSVNDLIRQYGTNTENSVGTGWHKRCIIYTAYPDAFGGGFDGLSAKLDHIADLGCNAVHVLPFFRSPGIDMGFDISDFDHIDPRWGGDPAFFRFIDKAKELNMHLFADLVLNHVSDQHEWAQSAARGDENAVQLFIHSKQKPELLEIFKLPGKGPCARYRLNGVEFSQQIIFPSQVPEGELPHWRKFTDDGPWFYHSFYPHQLDVNWLNPEIFLRFARIMCQWARRGLSFRLDAIPFIGRNLFSGDVVKDTDGCTEITMKIVSGLRKILSTVNPDSVFLAEAVTSSEQILRFFEHGVDLAYDFHLCMSLWASLLGEDSSYVTEELKSASNHPLPFGCSFVLPLRTHDNLLLFDDSDSRQGKTVIAGALKKKARSVWNGAPETVLNDILRDLSQPETLQEIPGRAFSFLGEDLNHLILAFFFQASLPGALLVYQGDEFAMANDFNYMVLQRIERGEKTDIAVNDDLRDMGRAPVGNGNINVRSTIQEILLERRKLSALFSSTLLPFTIPLPTHLFGGIYESQQEKLMVLVNLSEDEAEIDLGEDVEESGANVILSINGAVLENRKICLCGRSGLWISTN